MKATIRSHRPRDVAVGGLILTILAPRPSTRPDARDDIDIESDTTADKVFAFELEGGRLPLAAMTRNEEGVMAEVRRSKSVPIIVLVLIVVGLNAAIHHRVMSPATAVSQTVADMGSLWSRVVGARSAPEQPS